MLFTEFVKFLPKIEKEKLLSRDAHIKMAPLERISYMDEENFLDKNPKKPPVMIWMIYNALPSKWEIDELDAKKSDIVFETIEIVFSKMDVLGTTF